MLISAGAEVRLPVAIPDNYYCMRHQPLDHALALEDVSLVRMLIDAGALKGHEAYYRRRASHNGDFSIMHPQLRKIILQETRKNAADSDK